MNEFNILLPIILKLSIETCSKIFSHGATLSWLISFIPACISSLWKKLPKSSIPLVYKSLFLYLLRRIFVYFDIL